MAILGEEALNGTPADTGLGAALGLAGVPDQGGSCALCDPCPLAAPAGP